MLPDTHSSMVSIELLVGLVVGVGVLVIVLLLLVVYLCCKRRRSAKEKAETKEAELGQEKHDIETEKDTDKDSGNNSGDSLEENEENELLLTPETPEEEREQLVEASKPRFSSPIWLDEIHNNKIFNKQRSINTDDTPVRPDRPYPVRCISEIIEQDCEEENNMRVSDKTKDCDEKYNDKQTSDTTDDITNEVTSNIGENENNKSLVPETDF